MADTFKKVTNNEMFDKISRMHDDVIVVKEQLKHMNGKVNINRKWIWGLSGLCGTAFLFIISLIFK